MLGLVKNKQRSSDLLRGELTCWSRWKTLMRIVDWLSAVCSMTSSCQSAERVTPGTRCDETVRRKSWAIDISSGVMITTLSSSVDCLFSLYTHHTSQHNTQNTQIDKLRTVILDSALTLQCVSFFTKYFAWEHGCQISSSYLQPFWSC